MKIRFFTSGLMAMLVSAHLFAAGTEQTTAGTQKELKYWHAGTAVAVEFMKKAVDEYNLQSKGSKITYLQRPASNEAMATAIAGKQGPDLLYFNQNTVWVFGSDALYPLTAFVKDPKIGIKPELFMPAPRMTVNYGGEVVALPLAFGVGAVKYNIRLIEAAGLDAKNPPKTWAEFEKWAQALTIRQGDQVVQWGVTTDTVDWLLQEVMFANGGDWNNDTMTEYAPNKAELVEGLTWVNRLVNELKVMPIPRGVTWTGSSQMLASEQSMVNEKIAMQIGHHGFSAMVDQNPNLKVGLFPIPRGPKAGATVRISTGYDGFHVMHDTVDARESYLFAKWMVENKASDFAWLNFTFPAYAKNLDSYRNDARYASMVDHLLKSPVRRFHLFPARLDVRSQEPALVENILLGRMTPLQAVETFKEHAARVFKENRKELDDFVRIQKIVW